MESTAFSFATYQKQVDFFVARDGREINFQNRILLPLLEHLFAQQSEIDIVDVSTQFQHKESAQHTRQFYAWQHTPDLLIARDWTYQNWDKPKSDYLALIEIKSPALAPLSAHHAHTRCEVDDYRAHGMHTILTDCYAWVFYPPTGKETQFVLHTPTGWVNTPQVWHDLMAYIPAFVRSAQTA